VERCGFPRNGPNLSDFDWQYFFSMRLTVESIWSAFCKVLYEAVELYVPYATTNMAGTKNSTPEVPQRPKLYVKHFHESDVSGENIDRICRIHIS